MKFVAVAVLLLSVASTLTSASRVCGLVYVWQNNNMTCPSSDTVCADVFETTRNWYNGTTCEETRILHQCKCPGNQICPTSDSSQGLYDTKKKKLYTCQSACSFPWCVTSNNVYPMATVEESPYFGGRLYKKIGCRCPLHHTLPRTSGYRSAVRSWTTIYSSDLQSDVKYHRCRGPRRGSDPCA